MGKNSGQKGPKFAVVVQQLNDRYHVLVDQANKLIRSSDAYTKFVAPKEKAIQADADKYLATKAEIELLTKENEKLADKVREECGLSNRWYDSEDFTTIGKYYSRRERDKTFEDKLKSSWLETSRVNDLVRVNLEKEASKQLSVEELATRLYSGTDISELIAEIKGLVEANLPAAEPELEL